MTTFAFRAARADGEVIHGRIDAVTATAALDQIAGRGLLALEIGETAPAPRRPVAGDAELAAALAGLAALLDTGMPADRALAAAAETASPRLAAALTDACTRVHEGASLSAALDASNVAPPLVLGYLKAGERAGTLAAAAARAAEELEREVETRSRIRAALTYPAFLGIAGAVSVAAIAGFVVPRFAELLGDQGRALPATTRALLAVSHAVSELWLPVLAFAAVAVLLGARWAATPAGALALHRRLLDLPIVGELRLRFASARACGALAGLLEAGVPMLGALDLAREAAGDRAVAARIGEAKLEVERGERLSGALKRHAALTPAALRLVAFGDQAGRLAAFLRHAARLEAAAAHRSVQRAVTLVEPVLILAFGAAVAFVAAALLQAVYSVRPGGV